MSRGLVVATSALAAWIAAAPAVGETQGTASVRSETTGRARDRSARVDTFSNELVTYQLEYTITGAAHLPKDTLDLPAWKRKSGPIPLGMTVPTPQNWQSNGFVRWEFDGHGLRSHRADVRVISRTGDQAVVDYVWDTPRVAATLRFVLTRGSDKLLLFGSYEPRAPVAESRFRVICHAGNNNQITTRTRTVRPPDRAEIDRAAERWMLLESRTGKNGPCGLLIGTPDAFSRVSVPLKPGYAMNVHFELAKGARAFALALYEFPDLPGLEETREYFRKEGDREARMLEQGYRSSLVLEAPAYRRNALEEKSSAVLTRPYERFAPDPQPLDFPWARPLAGGPVKAVLFCSRYQAYEPRELARRLEMEVSHLYFDHRIAMVVPGWPRAKRSGVDSLGSVAAARAQALWSDPDAEVFFLVGLEKKAVSRAMLDGILEQVKRGKGLVITTKFVNHWLEDIFGTRKAKSDPALTSRILDAFPWKQLPGFSEADPVGELGAPLYRVYRYGRGRVVLSGADRSTWGALIPRNGSIEGLDGATDRWLAMMARATLVAAGRTPAARLVVSEREPSRVRVEPADTRGTLLVRVQDDLDRPIHQVSVPLPLRGRLDLPTPPAGRTSFLDLALRDAAGGTLDFRSLVLPAPKRPAIAEIAVEPVRQLVPTATPLVPLPEGGPVTVSVRLSERPPSGAQALFEVRDAFDRLLATTRIPAEAERLEARLDLPRPVTAAHRLDVQIRVRDREIAAGRLRLALPLPMDLDEDFGLMLWGRHNTAPFAMETRRRGYEEGAQTILVGNMAANMRPKRGRDVAAQLTRRDLELPARAGLRPIPFALAEKGKADAKHFRTPCLHSTAYLAKKHQSLMVQTRQGAPYSLPAINLGDENYLLPQGARFEACLRPETLAAFRRGLRQKYGDIARLNAVWDTEYATFDAVVPLTLDRVAKNAESFAPWFDHKRFMDTAYADTYAWAGDVVRRLWPGLRVGFEGSFHLEWKSGLDYTKLVKTSQMIAPHNKWDQSELVRSLKRPGTWTGVTSNNNFTSEAHARDFVWYSLFTEKNFIMWYAMWGSGPDIALFYPDLSVSEVGEWAFSAAREASRGPGRLLFHGRRDDAGIAVLYNKPDEYAVALLGKIAPGGGAPSAEPWRALQKALPRAIVDLGYGYRFLGYDALDADPSALEGLDVLFLNDAFTLTGEQVRALTAFVRRGGTLVATARSGRFTGEGRVRKLGALDALLGVETSEGLQALRRPTSPAPLAGEATLSGTARTARVSLGGGRVGVLDRGLRAAAARSVLSADGVPLVLTHALGEGRAVTLNFDWMPLRRERLNRRRPHHDLLAGLLDSAGKAPVAGLRRADGLEVRGVDRVRFVDGDLSYLGVVVDQVITRGLKGLSGNAAKEVSAAGGRQLAPQKARLSLPAPRYVYDVRAGRALADGKLSAWDATVDVGDPKLYALLPYRVEALSAEVPAELARGDEARVRAAVATDGARPGFHVVRLDVFPPGAGPDARPHRQYSRNVPCDEGRCEAAIPFALSDPPGSWRIHLRDVATGVAREEQLILR